MEMKYSVVLLGPSHHNFDGTGFEYKYCAAIRHCYILIVCLALLRLISLIGLDKVAFTILECVPAISIEGRRQQIIIGSLPGNYYLNHWLELSLLTIRNIYVLRY